jgi:hypothetical protein
MDTRSFNMKKLTVSVYDKPGTFDRYTVVINDDFYGMSEDAIGFNMFVGEKADGMQVGRHLGKLIDIDTMSIDARRAILSRVSDYIVRSRLD